MNTIKAKGILSVDTISKGNDTPWKRLNDYIIANIHEPTEFDFEKINVVHPYNSPEFSKLLANPLFYMTLHEQDKVADSIKLLCTFNGINPDKIKNITAVKPVEMTKEERNIDKISNELLGYIVKIGDTAVIEVYKRFDQIGQPSTIDYIVRAVEKHHDVTGCTEYIIKNKGNSIQDNIINYMTVVFGKVALKGIHIRLDSDNKDINDKIEISIGINTQQYTKEDRFSIMKEQLKVNKVGILTKYRESRSKDEFGRMGKGEKVSIRPAIFKGFKKSSSNEIYACFESYNSKYLYTREHWELEHDGEELQELVKDEVVIRLDELGIYNDFIGTKYHFSSAVQFEPGGETTMYQIETKEDGTSSIKGIVYTIPERIKAVFDDFGVEYDKEGLDNYIKATQDILRNY